jgi:hypothetical protein
MRARAQPRYRTATGMKKCAAFPGGALTDFCFPKSGVGVCAHSARTMPLSVEHDCKSRRNHGACIAIAATTPSLMGRALCPPVQPVMISGSMVPPQILQMGIAPTTPAARRWWRLPLGSGCSGRGGAAGGKRRLLPGLPPLMLVVFLPLCPSFKALSPSLRTCVRSWSVGHAPAFV